MSWFLFCLLLGPTEGLEAGFIDDDFFQPQAVRVDARGRIFVVDSGNHRIVAFDEAGERLFEIGGRRGQAPGEFDSPADVAFAANGDILAADHGNRRIQRFGPEGAYRDMIKISHPVGTLLALPNGDFVLTESNGFSFAMEMGGDAERHRFRQYNASGEQTRAFGSFQEHENPLLQVFLNNGPVVVLEGTLVMASSLRNELTFYGDKETTARYPIAFEPREPEAKMTKAKGPDGSDMFQMRVVADMLCRAMAALPPDALLMLRAIEIGEDGEDPRLELVKLDRDGALLKRYPGVFHALSLAVSTDGSVAYIALADDEGWTIGRRSL